ncbi:TIGR03564 family F420-dependent LLM class oxidoreductase [Phenylobacterium sp.]|jgi:F420-dependent oxidoreductase-like protein|uniref:TIGR03564 family F420-dependent LLM class oxidoreductase n=1 Tax=Phenylobacterium sp. TaxID=1871053 RepID=UPI002F3E204C
MDIGLITNHTFWGDGGFLDHVEDGVGAEADGFVSYWVEQTPRPAGVDALTCLAVTATRTKNIRLGVSVIPTIPRHPVVMCQQALSMQIACGGRFVLGLGPSHARFMEGMYGLSYDRPARQTEEFLKALTTMLRGDPIDFSGDFQKIKIDSAVKFSDVGATDQRSTAPPPPAPPVVLAAMGPVMLRVAGELADGIVPGVAGPKLIETYFEPRLREAAQAVGRKTPRIIVSLPVALVPKSQVDEARQVIDAKVGMMATLPPYKRMLDMQDVKGPSEISLVGDEATILAGLRRLADAGLDEYLAMIMQVDAETGPRTQAFMGEVARKGGI